MIEVNDLSFQYGDGAATETVLHKVSLSVKKSQLIVLSGPSGSGKTTLLTVIGALRRADTGSVQICNEELINANTASRTDVRRNIGYIFQHHNLLNSLNCVQNVCTSLELRSFASEKERKEAALNALSEVDMGSKAYSYPAQLSGGQKQRVSIARAIAGSPQLILADEPTASLDKKNATKVIELLRDACDERGMTAVVVTHDHQWFDAADSVLQLQDGRVSKNIVKQPVMPTLQTESNLELHTVQNEPAVNRKRSRRTRSDKKKTPSKKNPTASSKSVFASVSIDKLDLRDPQSNTYGRGKGKNMSQLAR